MVMVALERMPAGSVFDLGCGELKLQVLLGVHQWGTRDDGSRLAPAIFGRRATLHNHKMMALLPPGARPLQRIFSYSLQALLSIIVPSGMSPAAAVLARMTSGLAEDPISFRRFVEGFLVQICRS
jgi:hypothetical protein